jgi:hypothetical protein
MGSKFQQTPGERRGDWSVGRPAINTTRGNTVPCPDLACCRTGQCGNCAKHTREAWIALDVRLSAFLRALRSAPALSPSGLVFCAVEARGTAPCARTW